MPEGGHVFTSDAWGLLFDLHGWILHMALWEIQMGIAVLYDIAAVSKSTSTSHLDITAFDFLELWYSFRWLTHNMKNVL